MQTVEKVKIELATAKEALKTDEDFLKSLSAKINEHQVAVEAAGPALIQARATAQSALRGYAVGKLDAAGLTAAQATVDGIETDIHAQKELVSRLQLEATSVSKQISEVRSSLPAITKKCWAVISAVEERAAIDTALKSIKMAYLAKRRAGLIGYQQSGYLFRDFARDLFQDEHVTDQEDGVLSLELQGKYGL